MCVGLDNRWLVTLNSEESRDHLLRHGLNLFNKKIKLRRYDDVLNDEYIEYQQYEQLQKKLYFRQQQLDATSGAGARDRDELDNPDACWDQHDDELQDRSGLHVVDPHRGPPTTAVNTPEPPHTSF